MSSRFVSGGAIDAETGEATTAPAPPPARETAADLVVKKGEWLAVQKELEAERQQREAHRLATAAEPEKSLFEVLQANKGAFVTPPGRGPCRRSSGGSRQVLCKIVWSG